MEGWTFAGGVLTLAILFGLGESAVQAQNYPGKSPTYLAGGRFPPQTGIYYCPPVPCPQPAAPAQPTQPAGQQPETKTPAQQQAPTPPADTTSLTGEQFGGLGGQLAVTDNAAGYIDNAIIGNQVRFRADAAFNDVFPDRAEFLYPQCGCFRRFPGNQDARGPALPESRIDYEELSVYAEVARSCRFSFFVELPVRFIEPAVNPDAGGMSDLNAGFKYGLITCKDRYLTFQLRVYAPTGDPGRGLGNGHTSIEPALLYYRQINEKWSFMGELRDWQPIGGTHFSGNIIRYGAGLGYELIEPPRQRCTGERTDGLRMMGVAELVGWEVLNGKKSNTVGVFEAGGDAILNLKLGPRVFWGRNTVYAGWGHALTDQAWYRDMMRLEYARAF